MKKLFILIFLIGLSIEMNAQPYYQPPYYTADVVSLGDYDLSGKSYYVSAVQYYTLVPSQHKKSQESFLNYLDEAMSLYGASRISDSLKADFYITTSVNYWDSNTDVSKSPMLKWKNLSSVYLQNSMLDGIESSPVQKNYNNIPDHEFVRTTVKARDNYSYFPSDNFKQKHQHLFYKSIIIEAFDLKDGNRNDLWLAQAVDTRTGSKFLIDDEPMLYLMMRAFGKTFKPQKCFIAQEDPYFALFKTFELGDNTSYNSSFSSTDDNIGVFLINRRNDTNEIAILIEDNNKISSDLKHKKYTSALRIGDRLIECSQMNYDVRPVKYNRLLKIVFPLSVECEEEFDLVFYKKGHPDKIKASLNNIRLN